MSVPYYGDFLDNDVVNIPFNTFSSNDPAASVTATDLADADIFVHKDGSATAITVDGATIDIDAPGVGAHMVTIDTNADAAYVTGSEYAVRINGVTVDGGTINAWIGAFSIERAGGALAQALLLSTKQDSDMVLVGADHDKTQSDIVLTSTKLDSDMTLVLADGTKTQSDIALIDAAIDSDMTLVIADHDKTQSDIVLISSKLDSDAVLADADHDKTQSDIALISGSMVSGTADSGSTTTMVDAALTEADTDYYKGAWIRFTSGNIDNQVRLITGFTPASDTITFTPATTQAVTTHTYEILAAAGIDVRLWLGSAASALETAADVVDEWETQSQADPTGFHVNVKEVNGTAQTAGDIPAAVTSLSTKQDSDMVLAGADHDKTQSDVALIDAAIDSDMTLVLTQHTKTQSDIALIDAAIDSDMVLAIADHDKTQSDIVLISTKLDSDIVVTDAKLDSDMTLVLAQHTKTQSDIVLTSTKLDSDAVLADADHDKTQSDVAILTDGAISELAVAAPSATPTLQNAVMLLYMALLNKRDTTATSDEIHNAAGVKIADAAISDDATTFTKAKYT